MAAGGFLLETRRLRIRTATPGDTEHYLRLWNRPEVMRLVGFPHGLRIDRDAVAARLREQGAVVFDQLLVVEITATGEPIGECRVHRPDPDGVASTDVKLLPEHWGRRYGVEIKQALLDHLFTHTDCSAVRGTPNVENAASIRMQEAVGGIRVGEAVHEFAAARRHETCPVHHYIYLVSRSRWAELRHGLVEDQTP